MDQSGKLLGNNIGGRDYIVTAVILLGMLHLGDSLEMADCSMMLLGEEAAQSLLWSPAAKIFEM